MYLSGVLRCAGVALSLNPFSGPLPAQPVELQAHLERQIPEWLERYEVPGVSVALIHDARLVWSRGFGLADVPAGIPMTDSTLFQAGNISHSLTIWGIYRLVEQGIIELDQPVEAYLDAGTYPVQGIGDPQQTTFQMLTKCVSSGEKNSGTGFSLLEKLIEKVSGEKFPAYMQREIFLPLGMSGSRYGDDPASNPRKAVGHDALLWPLSSNHSDHTEGLNSTVKDLARFVAASLPSLEGAVHGYPVLDLATIQLMQQPIGELEGWQRYRAGMYAMGYNLETSENGYTVLSNYPDQEPGWRNQFYGVPETGDGLVILTNGDNGLAVINAITHAWSAEAHLGDLQLVRSLTGLQRIVMGFTIGTAIAAMLLLWLFFRSLRREGRRLVSWSHWPARLPVLILIGGFWGGVWIISHRWLPEWLPYLASLPWTAVNVFCGVSVLIILFPKSEPILNSTLPSSELSQSPFEGSKGDD